MLLRASTALIFALAVNTANAQQPNPAPAPALPNAQVLTTVPGDALTINHWYKQNVYDPNDNKIGEIMDVLVDHDGKVIALMVGVGGFLGAGEKDVAVPPNALRFTNKNNNKWYLVMNTTKEAMKAAPGYKYDRNAMVWIPDSAPATIGGPAVPAPQPNPAR
jgi:sporulation protein YlmC with PRC-barrel domain